MLQLLGLFLLSVVHSAPTRPLSYEDAYHKAEQEEKVLLVVVGAEWCVACEKLKTGTLEPMKKAGKLDSVVMAQVDKDQQPELAKAVMSGNTLPQLVAFRQTPDGWKRFSLNGLQSEGRVEELIRVAQENAGSVKLANQTNVGTTAAN